VKAAAAMLGASLLFFLGVLTGAGRRESVPPPAAITLGVEAPTSADGTPAGRPRPSTPPPTTRGDGSSPSTTTSSTSRTEGTTPSGPTGPTGPGEPSSTTSTTGAPSDVTATTTATTADPGRVEQVDGQVDCRSGRKQGKGKREPCPATTTSTAEAPGGGRNR
jgi:hypothetical protein